MGFFSSLARAVTRTAFLPLDIVSDGVRDGSGRSPTNTANSVGKVFQDVEKAVVDPIW